MTENEKNIIKAVNESTALTVLSGMYAELPITEQIKLEHDLNDLVLKYLKFRSIENYLENRKAKRSTIK